jgi:hypothetical protein
MSTHTKLLYYFATCQDDDFKRLCSVNGFYEIAEILNPDSKDSRIKSSSFNKEIQHMEQMRIIYDVGSGDFTSMLSFIKKTNNMFHVTWKQVLLMVLRFKARANSNSTHDNPYIDISHLFNDALNFIDEVNQARTIIEVNFDFNLIHFFCNPSNSDVLGNFSLLRMRHQSKKTLCHIPYISLTLISYAIENLIPLFTNEESPMENSVQNITLNNSFFFNSYNQTNIDIEENFNAKKKLNCHGDKFSEAVKFIEP